MSVVFQYYTCDVPVNLTLWTETEKPCYVHFSLKKINQALVQGVLKCLEPKRHTFYRYCRQFYSKMCTFVNLKGASFLCSLVHENMIFYLEVLCL